METTQVSRLRKKKLDSLSSVNQIRGNNESAKFSQSRSAVNFQKTPEFSQKLPNFSLNFSDTNQNNQSGRLPVLQEEELEQQKSHNVNKNTLRPMQTDATLLGPTCCVRLHGTTTMLALVGYSLKPVKLLGPCQRTQHCWPKKP